MESDPMGETGSVGGADPRWASDEEESHDQAPARPFWMPKEKTEVPQGTVFIATWDDPRYKDTKAPVRSTFPASEIEALDRQDAEHRPIARALGYDLEEEFEGEWFVVFADKTRMVIERRVASWNLSYNCYLMLRYEETRFLPEPVSVVKSARREGWCSSHGVKCEPYAHGVCGELAVTPWNIDRLRASLGIELEHDADLDRGRRALASGIHWFRQEGVLWANREGIACAIGWAPGEASSLVAEGDREDSRAQFTEISSISRTHISLVHYRESNRGVLYRVFDQKHGVRLSGEEAIARGKSGIVFGVTSFRDSWCRCGSRHSVGCPFKQFDRGFKAPKTAPAEPDVAKVAVKKPKLTKKELEMVRMRSQEKLF